MAVIETFVDTWLTHLPFVGGPRPSPYGPVDGIWYGLFAADGDASGGVVLLNGALSFDRKEDWIYILGLVDLQINSVLSNNAFIGVNTGPLIPTPTVSRNPSFLLAGGMNLALGLAKTAFGGNDQGQFPMAGMPIFGDKRISGNFSMIDTGVETNTNGAVYTVSSWGWLIRYNSFFRNVRAAQA